MSLEAVPLAMSKWLAFMLPAKPYPPLRRGRGHAWKSGSQLIQSCSESAPPTIPSRWRILRFFSVGANFFNEVSRKLSDSLGASTARASTMVATIISACSCAPGCPQSGN